MGNQVFSHLAGRRDIFLAKYTDNGTSVTPGWATSVGGTDYDYSYGVGTKKGAGALD